MLHQLLYVSVEAHPHTSADLAALLDQSRENNSKYGITGILIYYKRHFLQVLEGERDAVFKFFRVIREDQRHLSVILFWDQPVEKRSFGNWSMAFVNLKKEDKAKLKEFSDFLKKGFARMEDTDLTVAQKFLIECKKLLK